MKKFAGLLVIFLSLIGVSAAQRRQDHHPYHRPESQRHDERPQYREHAYRDYNHHREGFSFRAYVYVGPRYGHPWRNWDHRCLTLWDSSRWYISDMDIRIVDDWYRPDPVYVYTDDTHHGWYLLYNSRTGQTVHAEYRP